MQHDNLSRLLPDVVLLLHVVFVMFVVAGLILILVGGLRRWSWVRNPWFRVGHLAAIAVVVAQAWLGLVCPLTTLEMALRQRAGVAVYDGTFVAYWLQRLLYQDWPLWVFLVLYSLFGLAVLGAWWWVRPRSLRGGR